MALLDKTYILVCEIVSYPGSIFIYFTFTVVKYALY